MSPYGGKLITLAKYHGKPKKARISTPSSPLISVKLKRTRVQWDKLLKRARRVAGQRAAKSWNEVDQ
jgi:hypothetical protein